jgi:hypothetical protein
LFSIWAWIGNAVSVVVIVIIAVACALIRLWFDASGGVFAGGNGQLSGSVATVGVEPWKVICGYSWKSKYRNVNWKQTGIPSMRKDGKLIFNDSPGSPVLYECIMKRLDQGNLHP